MGERAVKEKIVELVCKQLEVPGERVGLEANYVEDLGADSLDMAELDTKFEDEFDVNVSDDDEERIATVGETVTYIEGELKRKAG